MAFNRLSPQTLAPQTDQPRPTFRSGAVARMAGMPVATLRIWEQRYQAVRPITAASGHRLYLAADVERVTLLRRLTQQGHSISLLAALDTDQIREMAQMSTAASPLKRAQAPQHPALNAVVVGQSLARRLQRLVDRQPRGPALKTLAVFDNLTEAAQAAELSSKPAIDLLLWQSASLQPGVQQKLRVAQDAWGANRAAVVYSYSNAAGRAELTGSGVASLHEPADDDSLRQWLASLQRAEASTAKNATASELALLAESDLMGQTIRSPRFDDTALTEFAGLSSAIACECPSHLAQLLLQISNFETYSGDCANRSAADAQLHAYLQRVAGAARMLFETALEQVAVSEGLPIPQADTVSSL